MLLWKDKNIWEYSGDFGIKFLNLIDNITISESNISCAYKNNALERIDDD